ncbi:hypothetical protein P691DRAFT_809729 [Macrolepiota fuliginosa MF-IS2]|uniref:Uncharacterized protein n=1 Tax=Macrolepiota fuliginosa MF-IS2 TaxID=1400762 RepID=A0A9P5XI25_9AGAR|nr:hypothetical protein P691DRAFT_809729 [Macrolepiota fuliginosa MF-IS2]
MSQEGADVFPQYAQYSIYDNIRDNILRCATGEFKNNTWYLARQRNFIKDYEHQPPHDLQQFACYVFIQGELELEVFGKEVRVQRLFVGYLGLFTSYDRVSQAKEVPLDPMPFGVV